MGPATMGERLNLSEHHSVLSAQLLEKARHAATPGEAHRLIERARIIDPTNPVVLEQSAMVHRREGRFMECIGDLLVARRRAQQSLALDGFSGVPDVLRRAPEAAKMGAQGRPLTAATSAATRATRLVIYSGVVSITLNHEVDDGAGGTNATEIVVKRLQAGDAFGEPRSPRRAPPPNKSVPSFCRASAAAVAGRVDDVSFEAEPPGLWVVQRNWKDLGDHHLFEPGEGTVEMLVAVLGSGQVFGELAVLDPNGRTPSSAVAVTNVEVYCLSKQALADVELLFDLPVVNYLNESLMLNNPPHKKLGSYYRNRRAWQDAKGRVLRKVMSGK
ncbi:hypothetical protein JL721_8021 [Aureococcus anophagefferens]|nr:hypothetical protein JL721_8021 [Aureococcus anophagefferens]